MKKNTAGMSFVMDRDTRELFKKIAISKHTNMASVVLIYIDEYIQKNMDEYIQKNSPKLLKE